MRPRIRSVKPEAHTDEDLWDAEVESGLPLFRAFVGLWNMADREGRFEWRPRALKSFVLPYWDGDFSRVLDALATRGFLRMYRVGTRDFGLVVNFKKHQVINAREEHSRLPPPPESDTDPDTSTRASRVSDVTPTCEPRGHVHAHGERKGTEGNGREQEGSVASLARREHVLARLLSLLRIGWSERYLALLAAPAPPAHFEALKPLAVWILEYAGTTGADPEAVAHDLLEAFFARPDLKRPQPEWLCDDPVRYLDAATGTRRKTKRDAEKAQRESEEREREKRTEAEAVPAPVDFMSTLAASLRGGT